MPKKVMNRKAFDNKYLHMDFHSALSNGIEYLDITFGEEAVREYLRGFAKTYYAPLISELKVRGLIALKEHFERIYSVEGGKADIVLDEYELLVKVYACPAVTYLRKKNMHVARLFYETTKSVNEFICEGTEFAADLIDYCEETGANTQRFYRRAL